MILLTKGNTSDVILTLFEKTTLGTPYYVFVVTCDDTGVDKIFTGVDVSTNINRYNQFVFELNSTEDLNNSVIDLTLKGYYKYKVYSTSVMNDLDINNVTELVESGKLYVDGDEQLTKTSYTGGNNTKVVYNG